MACLSIVLQFLKRETSMGNVSRQEEVSMIPPVLFDLKESFRFAGCDLHSRVFDAGISQSIRHVRFTGQ